MVLKRLSHFVCQIYSKTPLEVSLGLPFILLTLATVSSVGYFSVKNEQETVEYFSGKLQLIIKNRVEDKIKIHDKDFDSINRNNETAFINNVIDIEKGKGEEQFRQHIKDSSSVSFTYCAREDSKAILGVGRLQGSNSLDLWKSNKDTQYIPREYSLNFQGKSSQSPYKKDLIEFDPRTRPWYTEAKRKGEATWIKVYPDHVTNLPTLTQSIPVYNNKKKEKLLGICATDSFLPQEMTQLLENLKTSEHGISFIIQRDGFLISPLEAPKRNQNQFNNNQLLKAIDSKNITIQNTAKQFLRNYPGDLNKINYFSSIKFKIDGRKQIVQVSPLPSDTGLDLLIITVIPEADLIGQIPYNNYITLLSCITALVIGVGISILTARWITRPLVRLSRSAKALARGEWSQTVAIERSGDLGELAASFNWMAQQLQATFTEERRQAEEALQRSEAKFRRLFEADLIGAIVADLDGTVIEANDAFLNIVYYTQDNVKAGKVNWVKMTPSEYEPDDHQAIEELRNNGVCSSYEKEFCDKDGRRVPVLIGYALLPENQQRMIGFVLDLTQQKEAALAEKIQAEEASKLETSNRFAAWAHDTFAQDFAAIKFQADGVESLLADNPKAQATIRIICELATEGLRVARDVVEALPPESSQPLTEDLSSTLELWIDQYISGQSLKVQKNIQPSPDSLPDDVSDRLLLVAREAIINTIKHANASILAVELTFDSTEIRLRVQDNGNGFEPDHHRYKGSGLEVMKKRIQTLGGKWFISSSVGKGTKIVVTVPLVALLPFSITIDKHSPKGST